MKRVHQNRWPSGWRSGLTLIEVVVGIALAGTLLVSVILATTAQRRQLRNANEKQVAVEALDRFVSMWAVDRFSDRSRGEAAKAANVQLVGGKTDAGYPRASVRRIAEADVVVRITNRRLATVSDLPLRVARIEAFVGSGESADSWVEIVREVVREVDEG